MRTTYRIYTETKPNLAELTAAWFNGFTIYHAQGYWDGKPEPATIIELIDNQIDSKRYRAEVFALAQQIKRENSQFNVIVTEHDTQVVNV